MKKSYIKFILGLTIFSFTASYSAAKPQELKKEIKITNDQGVALEKALFKGKIYLITKAMKISTTSNLAGASGDSIPLVEQTPSNSEVIETDKILLDKVEVFSNEDGIIEITYSYPEGLRKTGYYEQNKVTYDYSVSIEGKLQKENYSSLKVESGENSFEVKMTPST